MSEREETTGGCLATLGGLAGVVLLGAVFYGISMVVADRWVPLNEWTGLTWLVTGVASLVVTVFMLILVVFTYTFLFTSPAAEAPSDVPDHREERQNEAQASPEPRSFDDYLHTQDPKLVKEAGRRIGTFSSSQLTRMAGAAASSKLRRIAKKALQRDDGEGKPSVSPEAKPVVQSSGEERELVELKRALTTLPCTVRFVPSKPAIRLCAAGMVCKNIDDAGKVELSSMWKSHWSPLLSEGSPVGEIVMRDLLPTSIEEANPLILKKMDETMQKVAKLDMEQQELFWRGLADFWKQGAEKAKHDDLSRQCTLQAHYYTEDKSKHPEPAIVSNEDEALSKLVDWGMGTGGTIIASKDRLSIELRQEKNIQFEEITETSTVEIKRTVAGFTLTLYKNSNR